MGEWTKEEIERLKELTQTMTLPHIAQALGRVPGSVRHQLRKHNLKTKVPWKRDLADAKKIIRYSDEHGCRKAAEHFGISVHAVKSIRRRVAHNLKKCQEKYSDDQLRAIRFRATRYAREKGYGEFAEDFASFYLLDMLTGNVSDMKYRFIDFLRQEFGDTRRPAGQEKALSQRLYSPVGENIEAGEINPGEEDSTRGKLKMIEFIDQFDLPQNERMIFLLKYHWGLTEREIGQLFGVSESRICQVNNGIEKKIALRDDPEPRDVMR